MSIGVPVYNGEAFLAQALASLCNQTHRNTEIIISDNDSSDGTRAIVEQHMADETRIRYHRQDENIGVLENFRFVAQQARGDFFFWAAHDDLWEPTYIDTLLHAIERSDVGLAYSNYDWIDQEGRTVGVGKTQHFVSRDSTFRDAFSFGPGHGRVRNTSLHYLWRNNFMTYSLFRTPVVLAALPFECLFSHVVHTDTVFLMKVFARARAVAVDEVLFHYRVKPRSLQDRYTVPGHTEITAISERDVDRTLRRRSAQIFREAGFSRKELAVMRLLMPSLDVARHLRERLREVWR